MKSYYGIDDDRLPDIPKPALQRYDNYQIYDIHCVDINTLVYGGAYGGDLQESEFIHNLPPASFTNIVIEKTSFLAVQVYNPTPILCDFNAIIRAYL
jgi:hypothetical protein